MAADEGELRLGEGAFFCFQFGGELLQLLQTQPGGEGEEADKDTDEGEHPSTDTDHLEEVQDHQVVGGQVEEGGNTIGTLSTK